MIPLCLSNLFLRLIDGWIQDKTDNQEFLINKELRAWTKLFNYSILIQWISFMSICLGDLFESTSTILCWYKPRIRLRQKHHYIFLPVSSQTHLCHVLSACTTDKIRRDPRFGHNYGAFCLPHSQNSFLGPMESLGLFVIVFTDGIGALQRFLLSQAEWRMNWLIMRSNYELSLLGKNGLFEASSFFFSLCLSLFCLCVVCV